MIFFFNFCNPNLNKELIFFHLRFASELHAQIESMQRKLLVPFYHDVQSFR